MECSSGGGQGWCADFQKGQEAYRSGDYATALREWKPLAENKGVLSLFYSKEDVINAQYFLGVMYDNGRGVPKDGKSAVKWYRLAAKQGNALNQTAQGVMYENGIGVPKDHKIAVKWFKLAAAQGFFLAQYNLGGMYRSGRGVKLDNVYAHMWGNLAASNGNESGGELRDLVAKWMIPADITVARKLAHECVRKKYKGC